MSEHVEALLRLGDDRLILGHRLSEWCGHAPLLEEELALANVALDLLGQARLLLERAGEVEGEGRSADDLAFLRDVVAFRNALLVEQPNGDFAHTVVRQWLFGAFDVPFLDLLVDSSDPWLAGFATKAAKENRYHRRHARSWLIRLGDGTEESHARCQAALDALWPHVHELFARDATQRALEKSGVLPDPQRVRPAFEAELAATLGEAGLARPEAGPLYAASGRAGRHGEDLGHLLSEMQSLARAHPGASW